jgi:ADP-heptose:LPS heptosyltransferase
MRGKLSIKGHRVLANKRFANPGKAIWINPVGGLGDTLMLSGILKQVVDKHPGRKFMLVRRPGYMAILEGHSAIAGTGFPKPGEEILSTDYWAKEPLGSGGQRPMQILGRMFGLEGIIREEHYFAGKIRHDPLIDWIPWGSKNIVIAPGSASPRKEWGHRKWEELARRLRQSGFFTVLMGSANQDYVHHTYSILGLTKAGQVFSILRRADLVITVDCFIMHASYYVKKPAIILWGPTKSGTYGYPGQNHLYSGSPCADAEACIGPGKGDLYTSPCPRGMEHCVDKISVEEVFAAAERLLSAT